MIRVKVLLAECQSCGLDLFGPDAPEPPERETKNAALASLTNGDSSPAGGPQTVTAAVLSFVRFPTLTPGSRGLSRLAARGICLDGRDAHPSAAGRVERSHLRRVGHLPSVSSCSSSD